jgi:hypothetical protein
MMSAAPTVPGTWRVVNPGRSLAVLAVGAATMQAAIGAASTASTLMFAGVFGDRWGGVPPTAGVLGVAAGSIGLTWLMGRTGRRLGLVAAYAVAAVGAGVAVAGVLAEPLLVVAGLCLLGVGNAGSQLARYAGDRALSRFPQGVRPRCRGVGRDCRRGGRTGDAGAHGCRR